VRADSPAWATEIAYLGDQIKAAANRTVGIELVKEVRVWTGPGRPRQGRRPDSPREPASAERPRAVVADPQTAFERAREAWSRRRQGES
jgi:hypothetical protein